MHEHKECEHELKYCSKCNVVYCEICNKEWYSYSITVSSPYTATWYNTQTISDKTTNPVNVTPVITCTHNS